MPAVGAELAAGLEQGTALVAVPSDSLAGLLVHEVLLSALGRDPQLGSLVVEAVVDGDGRVLLEFLGLGGPSFSARLLFGLGPLGGIASALLAPDVLAVRALLGHSKGRVAEVAVAPDTHANRLLYAQGIAFGRVPVSGVELESETLTELLRALLINLTSGNLGDTLGLSLGLGLFFYGLGGAVIQVNRQFSFARHKE